MPAFVFATSAHDATLAMRRAAERFWTSFEPHREITTSLGISGAVHLALLLVFGAAIYVSGTAPDKLVWEIGRRRGKPALLTFHGDRRVDLPDDGAGGLAADSDLRDKLQAAISAASRALLAPPHSPDRALAHA